MQRANAWLAGLDTEQLALLDAQIANAKQLRALNLPTGLIHGDLFHDNALYEGDALCGVIDFYNACTDLLAWDLAVADPTTGVHCPDGGIDSARYHAIVDAYQQQRALTTQGKENWQALLQLAAAHGLAVAFVVREIAGATGCGARTQTFCRVSRAFAISSSQYAAAVTRALNATPLEILVRH
ncbi:MAG: phosphotransferase [Pseudomonadales bacterium]